MGLVFQGAVAACDRPLWLTLTDPRIAFHQENRIAMVSCVRQIRRNYQMPLKDLKNEVSEWPGLRERKRGPQA